GETAQPRSAGSCRRDRPSWLPMPRVRTRAAHPANGRLPTLPVCPRAPERSRSHSAHGSERHKACAGLRPAAPAPARRVFLVAAHAWRPLGWPAHGGALADRGTRPAESVRTPDGLGRHGGRTPRDIPTPLI